MDTRRRTQSMSRVVTCQTASCQAGSGRLTAAGASSKVVVQRSPPADARRVVLATKSARDGSSWGWSSKVRVFHGKHTTCSVKLARPYSIPSSGLVSQTALSTCACASAGRWSYTHEDEMGPVCLFACLLVDDGVSSSCCRAVAHNCCRHKAAGTRGAL